MTQGFGENSPSWWECMGAGPKVAGHIASLVGMGVDWKCGHAIKL